MNAPTTNSTTNPDREGREDFRHLAACRGVDPEVFFPTAEDGLQLDAQVAAAKAVCARCLVQSECLAWALVMWISTGRQCREQCVQVGDMSVTLPRPVRGVVVGGGR
jgi:hypothetical protein